MDILTSFIHFNTKGSNHILDITEMVNLELEKSGFKEGSILIFSVGSTTGISTLEYEPGLVDNDIEAFWQQIAPYGNEYQHNKTWGDNNGASHIRSMVNGTSLNVPFLNGEMILGTWQQIVFVDFDTQPRSRKVVVQITGKK